jgi:hypothetical protein
MTKKQEAEEKRPGCLGRIKGKGKIIAFLVGVTLVAFVCLGGVLSSAFWQTDVLKAEIAPACDGEKVPQAALYQEGPGPHPIEVLESGRRLWATLPEGWQPTSVPETELVACVGPWEEYRLQVCPYQGGPDITRYGYRRKVTLRTARTAEFIASETFTGDPPRECKKYEDPSLETLKGKRNLDRDEVLAWLGPYVVPGQGYGSAPDAEEQERYSAPTAEPVATLPEPPTAPVAGQPPPLAEPTRGPSEEPPSGPPTGPR